MTLLLVGFEPGNSIRYPHLREVAGFLSTNGADYCRFRERGYFLGESVNVKPRTRTLMRVLRFWIALAVDVPRLVLFRLRHRYETVIAIDNFAYLVAVRLFPKVILWSHDFLTDDEPRSAVPIQRLIKREVARALGQQRRLIIQDRDRLALFCQTYLADPAPPWLDSFLLPVSLRALPPKALQPPAAPPVLMQIGGISAWRSFSDLLLAHYQRNAGAYRLAFHGYLDSEMQTLIGAAAARPRVSAGPVDANELHHIVEGCDLGFVAYNAPNLNFYCVARASGQLAEFLRAGKPVISLGPSSLGELLERDRLGRNIADIEELPKAIADILADYPRYSANCRRAFAEVYDVARYLPDLLAWLRREDAGVRPAGK